MAHCPPYWFCSLRAFCCLLFLRSFFFPSGPTFFVPCMLLMRRLDIQNKRHGTMRAHPRAQPVLACCHIPLASLLPSVLAKIHSSRLHRNGITLCSPVLPPPAGPGPCAVAGGCFNLCLSHLGPATAPVSCAKCSSVSRVWERWGCRVEGPAGLWLHWQTNCFSKGGAS